MREAMAKRSQLNHRDSGFTMVELVIAMVIIAGILLTLIAVQISSAATVVEARKRTQATAYANEAMEQMRALPWSAISAGLYTGFETSPNPADPWVPSAKNLDLGGGQTYTLRVFTNGAAPFSPRFPLYDSAGSNVAVRTDAAVTNTSYTIRSYVAEPLSGDPQKTVQLVVVVEWIGGSGSPARTVIESTAFMGDGCGDPTQAPYLGACQTFLNASSSSGSVSTTVTARDTATGTSVNLLHPSSDEFWSFTMRSAQAGASVDNQQVSRLRGLVRYGGTQLNDNDDATEPAEEGWELGFATNEVAATDDKSLSGTFTSQGPVVFTQGVNTEDVAMVGDFSDPIYLTARSDYRRTSTSVASTTNTSCSITGIQAGQHCAATSMSNFSSVDGGSGYMLMHVDGQIIRLSRRLAESTSSGGVDTAWAAKFSSASASNAVGCTTVSGAGCVSAGATRQTAPLSIGKIVGGTGWNNSSTVAPDGIVVVDGSGCSGSVMTEKVLVQRGPSQKNTANTPERCARMRYWTGGSYSTVTVSGSANGPFVTAPVSWSSTNASITAVATVEFSAAGQTTIGSDANCVIEACTVRATTGSIYVTVEYQITTGGTTYSLISTTSVDGPSATATYKETPDV